MISTYYQPAPNSNNQPRVLPSRTNTGLFPGWGPKV